MRTRTFKGIPTSLQARQKFEFSLFPVPSIWKRERRSCAIGPKKSGLLRSDDDDGEEMLNAFPPEWTKWRGGNKKGFFCLGNRSLDRKKRVREKEMMGWIRIIPINKPCWSRLWFINRVRFLCSIPSGREIRSLWFFFSETKKPPRSPTNKFPKKTKGGNF